MGAMARRLQVIVALTMGCAFGSAATGCALVWMGVARADTGSVVIEPCVKGSAGFGSSATHTFDGMTPEELTGIRVAVDYGTSLQQQTVTFQGTTVSVSCGTDAIIAQRVIFVVP